MLTPKRLKYRKSHRGRRAGAEYQGCNVDFGEYGLKAVTDCWMTARQIEAARIAMTRHIKRGGKVWIRIFPDKPVSKKPLETRQGKGKGATEFYAAVIKRGRVLFEMEGVTRETAQEALKLAAAKLPCKTKFVERETAHT